MKPTLITSILTGKRSVKYYFFPTTNEEEALEEAKKYKKPIPQCWDKWETYLKISEPGEVTVHNVKFQAPSPGWVLKFEHGSPS